MMQSLDEEQLATCDAAAAIVSQSEPGGSSCVNHARTRSEDRSRSGGSFFCSRCMQQLLVLLCEMHITFSIAVSCDRISSHHIHHTRAWQTVGFLLLKK